MLATGRPALGSFASIPCRRCWRAPGVAIGSTGEQRHRTLSTQQLDAQKDGRERVVILGSGWAGYTLGRGLDRRKYQVVVVSPRSYFVFTPLLASTSVGTLEFRTALEPVRSRRSQAEFFQGWADEVDFDGRSLTIEETITDVLQAKGSTSDGEGAHIGRPRPEHAPKGKLFDMTWDKLVIAVGCYSQTFGTPGVKENAFFLKDISDARKIRTRLLACFETAALPTTSEALRAQLLHFAVVGGGPTGIEWSAEMHDLVNEDMKLLYPDLVKYFRITVYDVAPRVLGMFDEKLSAYAVDTFKREGIDIKTGHHVEELRRGVPKAQQQQQQQEGPAVPDDAAPCFTLKLKEEGEVGVGMCVWSTGLQMNPFVETALADKVKRDEKSGGVMTDDHLQALSPDDHDLPVRDVYAIGDCAIQQGSTYPATAQVASQKALWLAKRLNKGDVERETFTYRNLGVMAYIGNWNAILQSGGGDISGRAAWLIWRGAYLAKAMSVRNKVLIPMYWFLNWVFGRDVSRF